MEFCQEKDKLKHLSITVNHLNKEINQVKKQIYMNILSNNSCIHPFNAHHEYDIDSYFCLACFKKLRYISDFNRLSENLQSNDVSQLDLDFRLDVLNFYIADCLNSNLKINHYSKCNKCNIITDNRYYLIDKNINISLCLDCQIEKIDLIKKLKTQPQPQKKPSNKPPIHP